MRFSDTMLGALLVAFGLAAGLYSRSFPAIPGQQYGAAVFPVTISIGFGICGLILLVHGFRTAPAPLIARTEWTRKPGAMMAVIITILCVIGYILFARWLGFIPTIIVVLVILFRMLELPFWQAVAFAIATAFACDFVFRSMLLVPLPPGVMPRLPW